MVACISLSVTWQRLSQVFRLPGFFQHNVAGFETSMYQASLMRVINRIAYTDEGFRPLQGVQVVFLNIIAQLRSTDLLLGKAGLRSIAGVGMTPPKVPETP